MVINHYSKERGMESVGMTALTPSYELSIMIASDKMIDPLIRLIITHGHLSKAAKRLESSWQATRTERGHEGDEVREIGLARPVGSDE